MKIKTINMYRYMYFMFEYIHPVSIWLFNVHPKAHVLKTSSLKHHRPKAPGPRDYDSNL